MIFEEIIDVYIYNRRKPINTKCKVTIIHLRGSYISNWALNG